MKNKLITFTSCCILAVVIGSQLHAVIVKGYLRYYYINYVLSWIKYII